MFLHQMIHTISDNLDYPDWCTIHYKIWEEKIECVTMISDSEVIGYAVIILDYDYLYNDDNVDRQCCYLASIEVKYKNKGLGSLFLKFLIEKYGKMCFEARDYSTPFLKNLRTLYVYANCRRHYNGAYIIRGELYEQAYMIIGVTDNEAVEMGLTNEYSRVMCKLCNLFHLLENNDECY